MWAVLRKSVFKATEKDFSAGYMLHFGMGQDLWTEEEMREAKGAVTVGGLLIFFIYWFVKDFSIPSKLKRIC